MQPAPKGSQWVQDPGGQWHLVEIGPGTGRRVIAEVSKVIGGLVLAVLVLVFLYAVAGPKAVTPTAPPCTTRTGAHC